jgi:putative ABC transport system permease protein
MPTLTGRVGLARRNLLADRRRLVAGVLGVGLALMLVLLLNGLWQGLLRQATTYPDRVGADLFVTQRGVADLLGDTASIPASTVTVVRATRGVDWADPVRGQFVVFGLHGKKVPSFLVGYVPGAHGGPWSIATGRGVLHDDEVVVGRTLARRHGLAVGQVLQFGGHRFRIVGLANASGPMVSFVFVTHATTDALLRAPATTSFVLVGTHQPAAVKAQLEGQGLTVLTRDQLATNDRNLYTGILGPVIKLMLGVAFVAGVLVVGLTIYASVVERRREYGIIKAIGASGRTITGTVVRQTLALTAVGLAVGLLLFFGARLLINELRPQFSIVLTEGGVVVAVLAAVVMALLASIVPARRVASAEPAIVYRER